MKAADTIAEEYDGETPKEGENPEQFIAMIVNGTIANAVEKVSGATSIAQAIEGIGRDKVLMLLGKGFFDYLEEGGGYAQEVLDGILSQLPLSKRMNTKSKADTLRSYLQREIETSPGCTEILREIASFIAEQAYLLAQSQMYLPENKAKFTMAARNAHVVSNLFHSIEMSEIEREVIEDAGERESESAK